MCNLSACSEASPSEQLSAFTQGMAGVPGSEPAGGRNGDSLSPPPQGSEQPEPQAVPVGGAGGQNTEPENVGGYGGTLSSGGSGGETGSFAGEANEPEPTRTACILPLGDSITQALKDRVSYRFWLWQMLKASPAAEVFGFVGSQRSHEGGEANYPDPSFDRDHEGHWGWRVDMIRERLPGWLEQYDAGIVLMHLGSNDAFQSQPTDGTLNELGDLIAMLRADNENVAVLLAQILPAKEAGRNARVTELNARLGQLAASLSTESSPVQLIDMNTGFDPNGDTFDGVHPNEQGEKKMATRWFDALEPYLSSVHPCNE